MVGEVVTLDGRKFRDSSGKWRSEIQWDRGNCDKLGRDEHCGHGSQRRNDRERCGCDIGCGKQRNSVHRHIDSHGVDRRGRWSSGPRGKCDIFHFERAIHGKRVRARRFSNADEFNFVYQPLSGDGSIVARVVSLTGSSGPPAGVMIRETLNTNATSAFTAYRSYQHVFC